MPSYICVWNHVKKPFHRYRWNWSCMAAVTGSTGLGAAWSLERRTGKEPHGTEPEPCTVRWCATRPLVRRFSRSTGSQDLLQKIGSTDSVKLIRFFSLFILSQGQFELFLLLPDLLFPPPPPFPFFLFCLSGRTTDLFMMSHEDDCSSLLSRLGSDSPRPRMKYGGMFCSVEGAFENKTLNFKSFSPQTQRHRASGTRTDNQNRHPAATGQTMVFLSERENYGKREVKMSRLWFLNFCLRQGSDLIFINLIIYKNKNTCWWNIIIKI